MRPLRPKAIAHSFRLRTWLLMALTAAALVFPACGNNSGSDGEPDPPIFSVKLDGETWSTTNVRATQFLTNPDSTLNTEIVATDSATGEQVRILLVGQLREGIFNYGSPSTEHSVAFVTDSATYEPDIRFDNPEDNDEGQITVGLISSDNMAGTFQGTLSRVGSNGNEKLELTEGSFKRVPLIF